MAIASLQAYQQRLPGLYKKVHFQKNALTTVAGHAYSSWLQAGTPAAGSAPTSSAVPTNATTGALGSVNATGGTQRLLRAIFNWAAFVPGHVILTDRLEHSGGLSATTTGAQTTNLPSTALTRQTGGVGVELGIEIYTQVGSTGTTVTASYTNAGGSSGQTTPTTTFGGTGFREASRIISLPLASGHTGVTAVASVTLAASTLTAGNFGVTMHYPLVAFPLNDPDPMGIDLDALFGFGSWFPQIVDNACLQFIYHLNATSTGVVSGILYTSLD